MAQPALSVVPLAPQEALRLLEVRAQGAGDELAARLDAGEDVLHYLAENGATATRRAVAANPTASAETNRLLADDGEDDVRVALARKIGQLFPGMLMAEREHLRDLAVETLQALARDRQARVRAVLAEEIKGLDCVPKEILLRLAHDIEESVAVPVVEHSPLLTDADLIEIVATAQANSILSAVARRKKLSAQVSEAVAATLDVPAVTALLRNTDAAIRKRTLDRIVSHAAEVAEWHGPLVLRAELSAGLIRRIARFAAGGLVETLAQREGLDSATLAHLKTRLKESSDAGDGGAATDVDAALRMGKLDDGFVAAAAEACQKETVVRALSVLAKLDDAIVRRILDSGSAKAVTALAWRAGLSMRVAFRLQTSVMRLKGPQLLPARGGLDFPLSEEEMRWHLGYFGVA